MEYSHKSVLLHESLDALNIRPDGVYVDGTLGGGGHSEEIAKRLTTGRLICIDRDERNAFHAGFDHPVDRVAATAANTNYLYFL